MSNPVVSVLMGVHNTPINYLSLAIESILNQTFINFEFIIIDDFSNESVENILMDYQKKDNRIILLRNSVNLGLTKSLNRGLGIAKGKYIARMDADDYSIKNRLEVQIDFLEKHQDIDVVGSFGYTGLRGNRALTYWGRNNRINKINMLYRNAGVPHPTAMFRRILPNSKQVFYNDDIEKSQDYDLWSTVFKNSNIYMMQKILLIYRVHNGQITNAQSDIQKECARSIVRKNLISVYDLPESVICVIAELFYGEIEKLSLKEIDYALNELMYVNNRIHFFSPQLFRTVIGELCFELFYIYRIKVGKKYKNIKSFSLFIKMYFLQKIKYDISSALFYITNKDLLEKVLYER